MERKYGFITGLLIIFTFFTAIGSLSSAYIACCSASPHLKLEVEYPKLPHNLFSPEFRHDINIIVKNYGTISSRYNLTLCGRNTGIETNKGILFISLDNRSVCKYIIDDVYEHDTNIHNLKFFVYNETILFSDLSISMDYKIRDCSFYWFPKPMWTNERYDCRFTTPDGYGYISCKKSLRENYRWF